MFQLEVKGHSGCQIDVVKDNDNIYVYKSTFDSKYLKRLALQAKKQQITANFEYKNIFVPKIYELQENDNSTIIKMQYIYSKNFIEFFEQVGFEQLDYFVDALINFVETEINGCDLQIVSSTVFRKKFDDIRYNIENNTHYIENSTIKHQTSDKGLKPKIQRILDRSYKVFSELVDIKIPVGICHGDLTFSNILFNGNNYYLIDFLDNFIETPLQDIVKIRQDSSFHWSQLMYTKNYDAVRLGIIYDKIDKEIDYYFSQKYQWYNDYYLTIQLMNILRILPYAHEKNVIDYLMEVLESILNKIDNNSLDNDKIENKIEDFEVINSRRTLIMPIAANNSDYENRIPSPFKMAEDGTMLCIKAIQSLDLKKYNHIYITVLRSHDEKYSLSEMLMVQFRIKNINNASIVVLDEPTASQPETIYKTIKMMSISGNVFVKDSDCSFVGEDTNGNSIVIYPLELLDWVNPKNKSYVNIDDMYYITNIIEKRIVSHYFTAGGYCFENAEMFCRYFERLSKNQNLYLSHIIYSMLLDKHTFRPIIAKDYIDFDLRYQSNNFCKI